mmetsp:Transcript_85117/g.166522  ORF Transcript_85117/g.166522 Transcript_85117/m.166522 type:complete len:102 (-) Transcript_85117:176-481(-)
MVVVVVALLVRLLLLLLMVPERIPAGPLAIDQPLDLDFHDSVAMLSSTLARRQIPYLGDFAIEIDIGQQDAGSVVVQKFLAFVVKMIQNLEEGLHQHQSQP